MLPIPSTPGFQTPRAASISCCFFLGEWTRGTRDSQAESTKSLPKKQKKKKKSSNSNNNNNNNNNNDSQNLFQLPYSTPMGFHSSTIPPSPEKKKKQGNCSQHFPQIKHLSFRARGIGMVSCPPKRNVFSPGLERRKTSKMLRFNSVSSRGRMGCTAWARSLRWWKTS